jgi:hypothetical protein
MTEKSISPNYLLVGHPISPTMCGHVKCGNTITVLPLVHVLLEIIHFMDFITKVPKARIHKLKLHGQ